MVQIFVKRNKNQKAVIAKYKLFGKYQKSWLVLVRQIQSKIFAEIMNRGRNEIFSFRLWKRKPPSGQIWLYMFNTLKHCCHFLNPEQTFFFYSLQTIHHFGDEIYIKKMRKTTTKTQLLNCRIFHRLSADSSGILEHTLCPVVLRSLSLQRSEPIGTTFSFTSL